MIDLIKMTLSIEKDKTIIPACDVDIKQFEDILLSTYDIPLVGGYKVGLQLSLNYGLPKVLEVSRKYTNKPIIYDHQKASTDTLITGKKFAEIMKYSGIDAVILFPLSGPDSQKAWIESALENEVDVIVGGLMTNPKYTKAEGGYIDDDAIFDIYLNAAKQDIHNFVVPANKPKFVRRIKELLNQKGVNPTFFTPGFSDDASIKEFNKIADNHWHAIIGRAIYESSDIRKSTLEFISQILV